MESNEYPEFKQVIDTLVDAFPRKISESFYNTYWEVLKDLSLERLKQNAVLHLKTARFFPVPAELRRDPEIKDMALLAWNEAIGAIHRYGYIKSVSFDDPAIMSAIEILGGWEAFNNSGEVDEWKRKHFCEAYQAASIRKEHPQYLLGAIERENRSNGFMKNIPEVKRIKCGYIEHDRQIESKEKQTIVVPSNGSNRQDF